MASSLGSGPSTSKAGATTGCRCGLCTSSASGRRGLNLRREVWPEGSRASRAARATTVALVLAYCLASGWTTLSAFGGTNAFYGITNQHATVAYSLLTEGTLVLRAGDFAAWWDRSAASPFRYIAPREVEDALRASRPGGLLYVYPPGYPLFLFAGFVAGGRLDYALVQATQAALTILGVPILLLITGRLLRRPIAGVVAAAVWGGFAFPVEVSQYVIPDGLMPFFGASLLAVTAWAAARDRVLPYAAVGLVLGAIANFRSDVMAAAPLLALGVWRARQAVDARTLGRIGAMALVVCATLLPYGFIQAKGGGHFRFSTPALGSSVWEGLGETANPCGATLSDDDAEALLNAVGLQRVTPAGEDYLLRLSWACASRHPAWFLGSLVARQGRILGYWERSTAPLLSSRPLYGLVARAAAWRRDLEAGIAVTPSRYRRETGRGYVAWALHHPGDFGRASLCRLIDSLGPGGGVAMFRLQFPLDALFALFRAGLFAAAVTAVVVQRVGLLLGATCVAYFLTFTVLHVEPRYLVGTLAPLTYLGCHGVGALADAHRARQARRVTSSASLRSRSSSAGCGDAPCAERGRSS